MRAVFYTAVTLAFFAAQTTAFLFTRGAALWPDLALLLAIYGGLRWGKMKGAQFGAAVGLVQDLLSYGAFGAHFFSKSITGFTVGKLREKYVNDSTMTRVILVIAATVFDAFSYWALAMTFLGHDLSASLVSSIAPQSLMNLVFCFIALPLVTRAETELDRLRGAKEEKYRDLPFQG